MKIFTFDWTQAGGVAPQVWQMEPVKGGGQGMMRPKLGDDGKPILDMGGLGRIKANCEAAALKGTHCSWNGRAPAIIDEPGEGVKLIVLHNDLPGGRIEL